MVGKILLKLNFKITDKKTKSSKQRIIIKIILVYKKKKKKNELKKKGQQKEKKMFRKRYINAGPYIQFQLFSRPNRLIRFAIEPNEFRLK